MRNILHGCASSGETMEDGILAAISGTVCRISTAISGLAVLADLSGARGDMLVVQGSTTFNRRLMEPHQFAVEEAAGHDLTVIPNKSAVGLLALLEGQADLAMISAPLEGEIEVLRKQWPALRYDRLRAFEISSTRV